MTYFLLVELLTKLHGQLLGALLQTPQRSPHPGINTVSASHSQANLSRDLYMHTTTGRVFQKTYDRTT